MKKLSLFATSTLLFSIVVYSQDNKILSLNKKRIVDTVLMNSVVVTANKFKERQRFISQKIEILEQRTIQVSLTNSTAGLLEQSGKVFVQRSQLGGGSPVLRGFEANRVLLVVDGVRMNNAIYRTGHLQNVITVDDDLLERVEILYGPSSTIYGSDALGGVIHMQTRKPELNPDKFTDRYISGSASARYSSAFNEYTVNGRVNIGGHRFASLTAIGYSSFGDLRSGNIRNPFYGDFGKRTQYIKRINGQDSIINNPDVNLQEQSAYRQYDFMQKFLFVPIAGEQHGLNIQYSTTNDIPRYDRLTDRRNGLLRWAEWYYGPQDRLMAAYSYQSDNLRGFFDKMQAGVSWQKIQESRMQRLYRNNEREHRIEDLNVLGYNLDFRKSGGRHELNVGTDGQLNFLKSTAYRKNIIKAERSGGLDTRYPDGNNSMHYLGLYAQHLYKIIDDRLILNDGVRVNYVTLNSTFVDTSILHLPFTGASQRNLAYSANLSLVYLPDSRTKINGGVSTGFRVPNIDDMAKVFESAGGEQLVVPNPNLKPERTYNVDLGLTRMLSEGLKLEATGFYTLFHDAIVLDRFTFNGQDEILYNGKMTPVVANQNKARAYIYGLQVGLDYRLSSSIAIYSHATYTYGRYFDATGNKVPLDHIPPFFGKTGLRYSRKLVSADFYALYNGWKYTKDYNPFGEDNIQYATPEGMPSWYTLNISSMWQLHKKLRMQVALENILDRNYRVFASGINGAGRNFVVKLLAIF